MWIIIIIIVVIIIGKFLYDNNQQSAKVAKEGGMRHKYRNLIQDLLSPNPRCKIIRESSDSITLGLVSNMGAGSTLFVLTQAFGKLNVQWLFESPFYGKHKLEWNFQEYGNQKEMLERMNNDVSKYLGNIMDNLG